MFTLGTAGHIDHGKTTLCQHLTGIDTDRLAEEKQRGISIELGFAHVQTPSGKRVGIVDVPGHERFIRTMVAGVSGMNAVLFVVAADEGIMPQTKEHFDILKILGVEAGIVVLTKCDIADEDSQFIVKDDIEQFLKGSPFEGAPIIETSPTDPTSYERVRAAIDELIDTLTPRRQSGHFRMPVDRVFSIRGHGTIVTGTIAAGTVKKGDVIEFLPESVPSRIRSVQVFGDTAELAVAGQRTALNVPEAAVSLLRRGTCCCSAQVFVPTSELDVRLSLLQGLPSAFRVIKHGTRIRFYLGTSEVIGRILVLDGNEILEGQEALVHVRLERPVVAFRGDHFLLRTFSPLYTIGGGEVLDPAPKRYKNRKAAAEALSRIAHADPREQTLAALDVAPEVALSLKELAKRMTLPIEQVLEQLPPAVEDSGILCLTTSAGARYCSETKLISARQKALDIVQNFHTDNPVAVGMPKANLQQVFSKAIRVEVFNVILNQLLDAGDIEQTGKFIKRPGFEPVLDTELERGLREARRAIEDEKNLAWTPKALMEFCGVTKTDMTKVIGLLLASEELVRLPQGFFASGTRVSTMSDQLIEFIRNNGGTADTSNIKDLFGLSRKHLIPFLELLDEQGITLRVGNERKLRTP